MKFIEFRDYYSSVLVVSLLDEDSLDSDEEEALSSDFAFDDFEVDPEGERLSVA